MVFLRPRAYLQYRCHWPITVLHLFLIHFSLSSSGYSSFRSFSSILNAFIISLSPSSESQHTHLFGIHSSSHIRDSVFYTHARDSRLTFYFPLSSAAMYSFAKSCPDDSAIRVAASRRYPSLRSGLMGPSLNVASLRLGQSHQQEPSPNIILSYIRFYQRYRLFRRSGRFHPKDTGCPFRTTSPGNSYARPLSPCHPRHRFGPGNTPESTHHMP